MASSSWSAFAKTVLIPMLIALTLYIVIFLVVLPLYRRYRSNIARYSNYTPLSSSLTRQTTSLFEPYLIEPTKSVLQKVKEMLVRGIRRTITPSSWAWDMQNRRGAQQPYPENHTGIDADDEDDSDGGLFDGESGEAMIGFDSRFSERGRGRRREQDRDRGDIDVLDSNRRLSRELEEGFKDDSDSEASDDEVTAGRRTVSRRGSEIFRS